MNTKVSVYPAVIIAGLIGVVWLLLWLRFSFSIESVPPETSTLPTTGRSTVMTATSSVTKPPEIIDESTPTNQSQTESRQGALRASNQTNQPLRIALLVRSSSSGLTHGKPAHWDFAPREGSGKGLVLSLPDGSLQLKTGDILVAFAQDGTRSYWGPFVTGETALPVWNSKTSEWQLILK